MKPKLMSNFCQKSKGGIKQLCCQEILHRAHLEVDQEVYQRPRHLHQGPRASEFDTPHPPLRSMNLTLARKVVRYRISAKKKVKFLHEWSVEIVRFNGIFYHYLFMMIYLTMCNLDFSSSIHQTFKLKISSFLSIFLSASCLFVREFQRFQVLRTRL